MDYEAMGQGGKQGDTTKTYVYKIASYTAKLKMFEVKAFVKGGQGKRASFTFAASREEIQDKFPGRLMAGIQGRPLTQRAPKKAQPPPKQVQPSVVAAMTALKAEAPAAVAPVDPFADDSDQVKL